MSKTDIILREGCSPKYIVQNLETIKKTENKIDYVEGKLEQCAQFFQKDPTQIPKKRRMSGYNCFIKTSVKRGAKFMDVVKSKSWSTLDQKKKDVWNNHAKNGCPPILWESKLPNEV